MAVVCGASSSKLLKVPIIHLAFSINNQPTLLAHYHLLRLTIHSLCLFHQQPAYSPCIVPLGPDSQSAYSSCLLPPGQLHDHHKPAPCFHFIMTNRLLLLVIVGCVVNFSIVTYIILILSRIKKFT